MDLCVFQKWITNCIFCALHQAASATPTQSLSLCLNSAVTCLRLFLCPVSLCSWSLSLSVCFYFFSSLLLLWFLCVFACLSFFHPLPLTHTLPPSLHLPVKRCSFLLVVIKSKVGSIREPVFESSSGCQRAFIPRALDVPLMASLCLSCLPTMPLLIHQPITALKHCGPFLCV